MRDRNELQVSSQMSFAEGLAAELPLLRRYARALTGGRESGDSYVTAVLEAVLADPAVLEDGYSQRVALYRAFQRLWASSSVYEAHDQSEDIEKREAVTRSRLRRLTPPSRQALLLNVVEGFSLAEIGQIMRLDQDHVETLIRGAMDELEEQTRASVLIIEDEPIIALDIEAIVREAGHDVTRIVDTHSKAVLAAVEETPDLVLADIQLADNSSGIDAVTDILNMVNVPVIFITAFPERLLTGDRPEPTFLISKPFLPETVKTAIAQAMFFREDALSQ